MESFASLHKRQVANEARKHLSDYNAQALAAGGTKKAVKKHFDPYIEILKEQQKEMEGPPDPKNELMRLVRDMGKSF